MGDEAILKPGELPTTWGLMVPSGKTMRIAVRAPLIASAIPPGIDFVAAIMRRCQEQSVDEKTLSEVESRVRIELCDQHREEITRIQERHRRDIEAERKHLDESTEVVRSFEEFVGARVLTDSFRREERWNLVKSAIAAGRAQYHFDEIERTCHAILRTIGRDAVRAAEKDVASHG